MKILLAALLFSSLSLPAFADSQSWVQAVTGGYEARIVTSDSACPLITTDKGFVPMTARAPDNGTFPLICGARLDPDLKSAMLSGKSLPLPVAKPQRILVLGDTGCRIKGAVLQACNDPQQWPFLSVATAGAAMKPDLVIHLGDYLYRESPCPPNNAGCAGSPHGDNWPSWTADLFTPARPLLAVAPWVILRGNHEDCSRAGNGFLRLLGNLDFDPAAKCIEHLADFTVPLGGVTLAVMDDANADDNNVIAPFVPAYASDLNSLADDAAPVWLAAHRPIWAAISGPLGVPIGGNATVIAAARANPVLIPPDVALMLSGHIHTFEAINYARNVPPQIVAGNGGDNLDVTPSNLRGAIFQGNAGVSVKDGLSVGGFGFLMMTRADRGWDIDLYDSMGAPEGHCFFTSGIFGEQGRVDCHIGQTVAHP